MSAVFSFNKVDLLQFIAAFDKNRIQHLGYYSYFSNYSKGNYKVRYKNANQFVYLIIITIFMNIKPYI